VVRIAVKIQYVYPAIVCVKTVKLDKSFAPVQQVDVDPIYGVSKTKFVRIILDILKEPV
jgi:hypothetical protein